jgi:hypothetical protein
VFDPTKSQSQSHGIAIDICSLVKSDLESRMVVGERKYGERLRPHNGRDCLLDAYQEALDLAMYLRQLIYERVGE